MGFFSASDAEQSEFADAGFVIARSLFSREESQRLSEFARLDQSLSAAATTRSDSQGGQTTLTLNNELGRDLYAAVVRCPRVADNMATLLGDEVYHYHHKMMLKEALVGGAWEWHQDYGYWYDYGCLFPDMGSCFIAVDAATRENGCLQVISGSHRLGRINHQKVGGQTGADPERVAAALKQLPLDYVELDPGDAVFFHGNLLHRSDQNTSPNPRWSLICCYNTKHNDPYKESRHPGYTPLETILDEEFLSMANTQIADLKSKIG